MLIKIHNSYRKVVAVCDKELLGKKFEEGKKQLEIRENFYNGDELTGKEVIDLLQNLHKDDATFNIVGEKSVKAALEAGIITKENIGEVQSIPFALVLI